MTAYSRPPRAISNDVTESKNDVPGRVVTNMPPASCRSGSKSSPGANPP